MTLEQLVPRLDLCKRLRELGYPQEGSVFYWALYNGWANGNGTYFVVSKDHPDASVIDFVVAAQTVGEMMRFMPLGIGYKRFGKETVRNFLNLVIIELLHRAEQHDQSKLQEPEKSLFDEFTEKLRGSTYGSPEYHQFRKDMGLALDHHYAKNRHHPEHFKNGVRDMNLIDLIEMLCDWKSSTLRHNDGNILKSIEINRERFGLSDDLCSILRNTVEFFDTKNVFHHAQES